MCICQPSQGVVYGYHSKIIRHVILHIKLFAYHLNRQYECRLTLVLSLGTNDSFKIVHQNKQVRFMQQNDLIKIAAPLCQGAPTNDLCYSTFSTRWWLIIGKFIFYIVRILHCVVQSQPKALPININCNNKVGWKICDHPCLSVCLFVCLSVYRKSQKLDCILITFLKEE